MPVGAMTFAIARIDTVVAMCVEDYYPESTRRWIRRMRKVVSATKCRRTTTWRPTSTPNVGRPVARAEWTGRKTRVDQYGQGARNWV